MAITADIPALTVESAAAGDAAALARIVDRYHDEMVRVCMVICRDADLAQDAAQSAWPLIWRKLRTLRDPQRLRPWLLAVAVNQARQLARSERSRSVREIHVLDDERDGPASTDDMSGIASLDVRQALEQLSPLDRSIVAMRYVGGFDSGEIAQVVGLSASGVRSRLDRAVDRLRKDLRR